MQLETVNIPCGCRTHTEDGEHVREVCARHLVLLDKDGKLITFGRAPAVPYVGAGKEK